MKFTGRAAYPESRFPYLTRFAPGWLAYSPKDREQPPREEGREGFFRSGRPHGFTEEKHLRNHTIPEMLFPYVFLVRAGDGEIRRGVQRGIFIQRKEQL